MGYGWMERACYTGILPLMVTSTAEQFEAPAFCADCVVKPEV